ncbi:MAG: transporter [Acetobacteraceae bacterium]|nr:transporter [Acetobacteraceae bacterium]
MLALKTFRDKAAGLADLLNWSHLVDSGIVLCKDGSLLAGWFYRAPDIASSTDSERNWLSARVNAALARLGAGWASWIDTVRLPSSSYPTAELSHFPDPISRLVDAERRAQFLRGGVHYEGEYAIVVQFTPPLRRRSKVADLIYDDDPAENTSPASRILEQFKKAIADLEDAVGDAVNLRRMESYTHTCRFGREHLRDHLVNYLHFALTGEETALNIPPAGAYLDAVIGGRELWPGDTPRLGSAIESRFICGVAIEGFPQESFPGILDALDHLPIPFRWSTRMIYLDQHETLAELRKFRRKWKQQVRGFWTQVFKTQGGSVNEDALLMAGQADAAIAEASSAMVAFGYYTPVIVLMDQDRAALIENARLVVREIMREGFSARIETVNTMEAWLGSLPGHTVPNVRRPMIHTGNLADLLPLAGVWTGREENPCPFYPAGSPPLMHGATSGATPFRVNLHVGDVGHSLIFGPTGAGKSVLLCTIALQALRYPGVTICAFDKGRSMWAAVRACGGRHYDVAGEGAGPAFCPLAILETETDMAWAEDWIATCFELQAGRPPVPHEREAIHRAMLLLRSANDRTLTHFVAQVQDEAIRSALRYYTLEGTLGRLLDAEEDGLADAPFLVFEIEDLMAMGERNLIPVLLYLFRRFERSLKGQPAYLLLDEAWVMLGHPVFRAKIREWLKVLRKANCAVVLATQSLSDAARSGILDVLIESCPTKIFLPNEEAGTAGTPEHPGPRDLYEAMGLNETQIDIIRTATKKRHYYLVSPEGRRLFDLGLGPIALSFAGISSKEQFAHLDRLVQREGERWPFAWLEEQGVDYAALQ